MRSSLLAAATILLSLNIISAQNILSIAEGFGHVVVSSEYGSNYAPSHIRLDYTSRITGANGASAWAAAKSDTNQWAIVNFGTRNVLVTAFCTQGRGDFDQWVTSYNLSFTINGVDWIPFKSSAYVGNTDRNTKVCYDLLPFYQVKAVKFAPVTWFGFVSARIEAYIQLLGQSS